MTVMSVCHTTEKTLTTSESKCDPAVSEPLTVTEISSDSVLQDKSSDSQKMLQ